VVTFLAPLAKNSYTKVSIGRAFAFTMHTEHRDQTSFCPFARREISDLAELVLGHLRYYLTDVPPQSNSPPGSVLRTDHAFAYLQQSRQNAERVDPYILGDQCRCLDARTSYTAVLRYARAWR
jgi:hypothetical protein